MQKMEQININKPGSLSSEFTDRSFFLIGTHAQGGLFDKEGNLLAEQKTGLQ